LAGILRLSSWRDSADRKRFFWHVSNSLLQAPSLYFRSKTFAAQGSAQCQISRLPSMLLTGQRVGCVVAATWRGGIQKQPSGEYVSSEAEQRGSLTPGIVPELVRIGCTKIRK
jgi:hypothetical protein